ncbi:MAG: sigma-70 family RNA polymerase sigma factor [Clostridiales bacterium]|nr:sigma-70 family RNA polymerase sigma factor [Clostridiales bacterium]
MVKVELNVQKDEELAELFRAGNDEAFVLLLSRYSNLIMKTASSFIVTSVHETDDYYQEGLIEFHSAVKSFDPAKGMSFRNYSMKLVKQAMQRAYKSANSKKRNISSVVSIEEIGDMACDSSSVEDQVINREILSVALSGLSAFENKVLKLYILGDSRKQISEKLSCSIKSVDNAIQRIRKKVKD